MVSPLLLDPTHVLAVQRGERSDWARELDAVRATRGQRVSAIRGRLNAGVALARAGIAAAQRSAHAIGGIARPAPAPTATELCCAA
ncbi:MAG: hypothetical protein ACXIUP_05305 [Microcella sp.]